ncbi:MAG: flagellar basal body P-ring formation chaperone FlgA [Gammaproteobacteria bacterium]
MNKKTDLNRAFIILLAGLMPTLASPTANSTEYQSLDSLKSAAKEFVLGQYINVSNEKKIEIIPGRLDPRLRLVRCKEPLETSKTSNSGNRGRYTVNIKCSGVKPWALFVPVQVKEFKNIVVLSNSLPRNTSLSQSDLRVEQHDINRLNSGYFSNLDDVVGKTLKRSLGAGLVITPTYVESSMLIKRGQQVTLLAQTGGITVKMAGKAMSNGIVGERIKVKNINSNKVIEGTITNNGLVTTNVN